MTESEEESSEEESSDEAFESDNEEKEEEKKDSLPKTRPPPIPKEKLAKVSSKKQLELQKIPSSKSLEETTKETVVETTSRSRGRAVEAVYGVTDGPCPGLYRTKKEAREKNPDSVIKSFGSYQDARESITTSLLEDKEDKEEGETSTSKVKMSPRTRKRVDQKHAEYNAFLALRSTLFNKKKDDSDVRTKNIAFAVSRCLEMSSRPRSSTSSSTTMKDIVNYSLLLGVFLGRPDPTWRGSVSTAFNRNRDSAMRKCHADEAPDESAFRYGIQCTADRNIAYTMGVIDILQEYDWKKMAETAIKAKHGKDYATSKVSAIPPKEYGIRFLRYVLGKCA